MNDINRMKPRLCELSELERFIKRPSGRIAAIQSHDDFLIHEPLLIWVAATPLDFLILLSRQVTGSSAQMIPGA
jgi:hypothetical protein